LELNRIGNDIINAAIDLNAKVTKEGIGKELEGNVHTTFWIASMGKDVHSALKSIDSYKVTNNE